MSAFGSISVCPSLYPSVSFPGLSSAGLPQLPLGSACEAGLWCPYWPLFCVGAPCHVWRAGSTSPASVDGVVRVACYIRLTISFFGVFGPRCGPWGALTAFAIGWQSVWVCEWDCRRDAPACERVVHLVAVSCASCMDRSAHATFIADLRLRMSAL